MSIWKFVTSLFNKKQNEEVLVKTISAIVSDEEAYIPYRSDVLNNYLLSRNVDLKDPLDASVKIKKLFKPTPDAKVLNGTVNAKRNLSFTAGSNVVIINLIDLILNECSFLLKSDIKDTIVIINVSRNIQLHRNARFAVRGISPDNVLINYNGSGSPALLMASSLVGTLITPNRLVISGRSSLLGETLRSSPIVTDGSSVTNKTTANKIILQKKRDAELEELRKKEEEAANPSDPIKKKVSDEKADNSIFEKPRWN